MQEVASCVHLSPASLDGDMEETSALGLTPFPHLLGNSAAVELIDAAELGAGWRAGEQEGPLAFLDLL